MTHTLFIQILSPAKINLHLRVGPLAPDGFHPLLTWMTTVGLADTIACKSTKSPGVARLTCNKPEVPTGSSNLILRAAAALKPDGGVDITLTKNIPIGGGLGGGSSNAAFTLEALNELWHLNHTKESLAKIAAQLGSDVPFFLRGPGSICRGRGEIVTPIPRPTPRHVVLIFPEISMPTPAIYRKFDEMNLGSLDAINSPPDWSKWSQLNSEDLLPKLVNDLEPPAFAHAPALGELRASIEQKIQSPVRLSGSGSTLFTLADKPADAAEIVAQVIRLRNKPLDLIAGHCLLAP